jgi:hypothetical protein
MHLNFRMWAVTEEAYGISQWGEIYSEFLGGFVQKVSNRWGNFPGHCKVDGGQIL